MIVDIATATLEECLSAFRERFNDTARVKKLIAGWNRDVLVEPRDTPTAYTLTIADLEMTGVTPGITGGGDAVRMQADEEILKRIFTGDYNPCSALIDGNMELFSSPRDRVTLEGIAMVIWGV